MSLVVRAPDSFVPERRYILDLVLGEWLGLEPTLLFEPRADTSIELFGDSGRRTLRIADGLFGLPPEQWLAEGSLPVRPLARASLGSGSKPLPILYGVPDANGDWIRRGPDEVAIEIDVFGGTFFMLSRYEERVGRDWDVHARFPSTASLAGREGFLDRAVVDEYVDVLWNAIAYLWPGLTRRPTAFRLRLTHDVDRPWATVGQSVGIVTHAISGDLVRRKDPALAARRARALLDARSGRVDRDPFNRFDLLMDTSERFGLRSTFYFMTGVTDVRHDGSYAISDPPVQRLLKRVHQRGHEIGLHASYNTFRSADQMGIEFAALTAACHKLDIDQPAWGVRQHYLRFEAPITWRNQAAAGLSHDSTLGYADANGFRAGTCREFPLFDVVERTTLGLRERPLIFMEAASPEFQAMDFAAAASRLEGLVATCRRHAGDAVILYHNSSLPGARAQAHYRELIDALARPG